MSVILRKRKNSDGTTSLLLDIYHNRKRSYEFLKNLKLIKVASPADSQANKDNLNLAKKIAAKRGHELSANDYNVTSEVGKKTIVTEWMQTFVDNYKMKDKRNMQGALNRFKDFLIEDKKQGIVFSQLTKLMIEDFQQYLGQHSVGEGASSYFSRFKKMIKRAYDLMLIQRNHAAEVKTVSGDAKKKHVLSNDDLKTLSNTPTESSDVKRAFLFSCMTGLRWCDVIRIDWSWIDLKVKMMTVPQIKTGKEVTISLNETAIKLLGKPGKEDELVFTLPTANGANKTVKAWVKRAGIKKKITWHCARHTFGTNLVFYGAATSTASNLLGHSSMKYTERYVRAANALKERSTDNLNYEL